MRSEVFSNLDDYLTLNTRVSAASIQYPFPSQELWNVTMKAVRYYSDLSFVTVKAKAAPSHVTDCSTQNMKGHQANLYSVGLDAACPQRSCVPMQICLRTSFVCNILHRLPQTFKLPVSLLPAPKLALEAGSWKSFTAFLPQAVTGLYCSPTWKDAVLRYVIL